MSTATEEHYSQAIGITITADAAGTIGRLPITSPVLSPDAIRAGVIGVFFQQTCGRVASRVSGYSVVIADMDLSIFRAGLAISRASIKRSSRSNRPLRSDL